MAIFGSSWLDEPIDDDRSIFFSKYKDETSYQYYKDDNGDMQKIITKRELSDAIDKNNLYSFDGSNYNLVTN